MEGTVSVVYPGMEEIREYTILIGRAKQFSKRQPHPLCKIGCKNISEIPGRHRNREFFSLPNLPCFQKATIGINIVHNLRDETPDIDRVCGREAVSFLKKFRFVGFIGKDSLYPALCIIKIPEDGSHMRILSLLHFHLLLLKSGHPVFRIKHDDFCPFHIGKSFQCRLPGISGSCRQNHDFLPNRILFGTHLHQIGQNGKRHILKGERLPVEEFQVVVLSLFHNRSDFFRIKLLVVGMVDTEAEFFLRKIREIQLHNFISKIPVT